MRSLVLAAAWLGAVAALASGNAAYELAAGIGAVALPVAVHRDRRGVFLACAALGVIGLAWLRWQAVTRPPSSTSIAWWTDGERRVLTGRVRDRPQVHGATQRFTVSVSAVEGAAGPVAATGAVQVRVAASRLYRKGDVLRLDGRLEPPPTLDGFDFRAYLARRGIVAVIEFPRTRVTGRAPARGPEAWLDAVRDRAHDVLWRGLPATEAALAEGILLGRRADIPRTVNEDFNRAGVSHLLVISGFNIALLGSVVVAATGWLLGRRRAGLAALLAIAVYSLAVGLSPPVARAALMGSLAVLATLSGRPHGAGTALVIAGAALTVHDPRILQDVSFQLSFAATAGLLVLAPWPLAWGRRIFAEPAPADGPTWRSLAVALWDTLAVTLAATVATLPLLLVNFERLSLVSPVANLLLVPLFPVVLVGGALGLAAAATPLSASVALAPLGLLLELTVAVARVCAHVPGATVQVSGVTAPHATLAYAALGVAAAGRLPGVRRQARDRAFHPPAPLLARPHPALALTPAALLVIVAGVAAAQRRPAGGTDTRVDVFDLAGAPAALVTLPGGAAALIDTGLSPGGARAALDGSRAGRRRTLAAVAITRDRPSATGGLREVLRRYRVALLLVPPDALERDAPWLADAHDAGVRVAALRSGMTLGAEAEHGHLAFTRSLREAGRWSVTVAHGDRRIALDETPGDAGITRTGRTTAIYVTMATGRLQAPLPSGGRAAVSTDGRRVHLHRPRGAGLELRRCDAGCDARRAGREP